MSCFSFQDNTRVTRVPRSNMHQPARSKKVFVIGNITCSCFTISCKLPPKLKSIQEAGVLPHRRCTNRYSTIPAVQWSVFSSLEEMFPGYNTILCLKRGNERVRQSDCDMEVEEEKKGNSTSKQEVAGRWMDWGRWIWEGKWVRSRWVTMLSLSSCSLTSLGSHFPSSGDRWSSPCLHFWLEGQGGTFSRGKGWRAAPLCPCNG